MIVRSKSPISSPMVGRAKSPVGGSEKAASPPKASNANLGRNPELVKRYRILDKREGFVGPFVIEYECVDSATNKIFWATVDF
jgi:hypothetical protein